MTQEPSEERPSPWIRWLPAIFLLIVAAVFVFTQVSGDEPDEEPPTTSEPGTSSTTDTTGSSATTEPVDETTVTSAETTVTTEPPDTTTTDTQPPPQSDLPERAIASTATDLVWVDPSTGATEVAVGDVFEASWGTDLALTPDQTGVYYHFGIEDYWFSCETAGGWVAHHDLTDGSRTEIAPGRPALSPDGTRLAYLASEECYPDPEEPDFFLTLYDTLVIANPQGNPQLTFPLAGEGEAPSPLVNLAWEDDETILVTAENGSHFRVTADAADVTPISLHETVDLPDVHIYAVVDGVAFVTDEPSGQLYLIDMATGESRPLAVDATAPHAVGVSDDGQVIVGVGREGNPVLLVDIDPASGEVGAEVEVPQLFGIDW